MSATSKIYLFIGVICIVLVGHHHDVKLHNADALAKLEECTELVGNTAFSRDRKTVSRETLLMTRWKMYKISQYQRRYAEYNEEAPDFTEDERRVMRSRLPKQPYTEVEERATRAFYNDPKFPLEGLTYKVYTEDIGTRLKYCLEGKLEQ